MNKTANSITPEAKYPISFRKKDTKALAEIIKKHESVCLVAMKKVGISNLVRFFYHHPQIKEKYFDKEKNKYLFIFCDLNDLLEISQRSFWILILKRFSEAIAISKAPPKVKEQVDKLFLQSITTTNPFFFFDALRHSIQIVAGQTDLFLVLFLLRFDRIKNLFSQQFFANMQSLFDIAKFHFIYATTSVRPLPELCPSAFDFASSALFSHTIFIEPAKKIDMERAVSSYLNLTKSYSPKFNLKIRRKILDLGGGHMMLTRLIGIASSESKDLRLLEGKLLADERIALALEEIWENLTESEKDSLFDIIRKGKTIKKKIPDYLFKTGILRKEKNRLQSFSPLFTFWIKNRLEQQAKEKTTDLTKKEKSLFDFLASRKEKLCRRDEIEEAVWSEYQESPDMAISDWAIDQLITRLRKKLKLKGNNHKLVTLRNRGYKLIKL